VALNPEKNINALSAASNHQKINFFLVISFGFTILMISAAVYLFIIKESFGAFPIADLVPSEKSFQNFFDKKIKIAVLYSGYTNEKIFTKSSILKDDINLWGKLLRKINFDYDIINDETIEKGNHLHYSVIILPNSLFLTRLETEQLKKFIRTGGSIFASGEARILLNDGTIPGRLFPPNIFDLSFSDDSIQTDSLKNFPDKISVFRGGMPLTSGIPAGYRLKISGENLIKAKLTHTENIFQIISNERIKNTDDFYCTAAYGIYEKGRFIWIGFSINSIKLSEDRTVFEKFLSNSVNWLLHKPISCIKDYPAGYDAAAVIAPVLSDSIKNIYDVLMILSSENIKASFFIDPETSVENLALAANLHKYGEIGVYFKDRGIYPELKDTLRKSKRIIELIAEDKCRGCTFFPGTDIDQASETAGNAEFDYLLTEPSGGYNPKYLVHAKGRKVAVFESSLDNYTSADSGSNQELNAYKDDIDSILHLNGLYVFRFSIDSIYRIKTLEKVVRYLKEKNFRITTFSEIQERFYQMQNLEISEEHKGGRRIFLHISNSGNNTVNEAVLYIDLNETSGINGIYIIPEFAASRKIKTVDFNSGGILSLVFENLKPGESRSYFIDYDIGNI